MKNSYLIENGVVTIFVTRRNGDTHRILVSAQDFNKVNRDVTWGVKPGGAGLLYATYWVASPEPRERIYMHRLLLAATEDSVVDHINGNTLDNRRENLRLCSQANNSQNRTRLNGNNTSGYYNVHKHRNKWRARFTVGKVKISLGVFPSREEAAEAARQARVECMPFSKEAREAT